MNTYYQSKEEPIMKWIYAGPFVKDVTDLYMDNYKVPVEPYLPIIEESKNTILTNNQETIEGGEIELFNQRKNWKFLRVNDSEKKATWAMFGIYPRFLTTYAYNNIEVEKNYIATFKLEVTGGITVLINGELVFEKLKVGRVNDTYSFGANLHKGSNSCLIILYNVHLHCTNSFSLFLEEDNCKIQLPLLKMKSEKRHEIEEDLNKFYLSNDIFKEDEEIKIHFDEPINCKGVFVFTLCSFARSEEKEVIVTKKFEASSEVEFIELCKASDLKDGAYIIKMSYKGEELILGENLSLTKISFIPPITGSNYKERKKVILGYYATAKASKTKENPMNGVYIEFAKLQCGSELGCDYKLDLSAIEDSINFVNARYDCSDFVMHGILRFYYMYKDSTQLPEVMREKIRRCILDFKYWEDEPGKSMMFTRSENHEMLFFSAEYLAGLLFPLENFTNSNQNGLFHALKGRLKAERWIKEKGSYGFTEWHSNTYYEEDMLALLNIYDFGEENAPIRTLSRNLLDLICFIISTHVYKGVLATTHGRCYETSLIHPETESMSHINWILFGQPERLYKKLSIGAVALATSKYEPNSKLEIIANSEEELNTITCMGLFANKRSGGVNCATYRTKDYQVSGMVESEKGVSGAQVSPGQILLDGNIPIFATCFDNKSETTRPSYWGGQYRNPKTITYKNILAYIYNINDVVGYTHCYFPIKEFDEVKTLGKWLFGRKNEAYVAVYSLKPYIVTKEGSFKEKELLCMHKKNIWLLQAGNEKSFGSFEGFVKSVSNSKLSELKEDIIYESPDNGILELGWDRKCTINGSPIVHRDFPLIENNYAFGEYGSGITKFDFDGEKRIINFNF